jgi:dihydroorotate dehydrogenase
VPFLFSPVSVLKLKRTAEHKHETGGLSGAPLLPLALAALRTLRAELPAHVALIGCGGVRTGADALEFARAGADAVQMYTALGLEGAGAARRVKDELVRELARRGTTWGAVVREAVERSAWKEPTKVEREAEGVKQLIREAEELRDLVDALARKDGVEVPA